MKEYKDLDKNSIVEAYEYDEHHITFRLKDGEEKNFTGKDNVSFFDLDSLKERSVAGRGLDEYIEEIESRTSETIPTE